MSELLGGILHASDRSPALLFLLGFGMLAYCCALHAGGAAADSIDARLLKRIGQLRRLRMILNRE